jgi:hypothetical protein
MTKAKEYTNDHDAKDKFEINWSGSKKRHFFLKLVTV